MTAVAFHPTIEGYFLTGSFDRKLRIWNIPQGRVIQWVGVRDFITSACFSPDGKLALAGLFTGQVVFYHSDGLRYYTQIDCRNKRGKFSKGMKVTGLEWREPDNKHGRGGKSKTRQVNMKFVELLVTTNDSRLRLIHMDDFCLSCKFKGNTNESMQISATLSDDGKHVVCGSEDGCAYIWRADHDQYKPGELANMTGYRKDKSASYEQFRAQESITTCTLFAPRSVAHRCRKKETNKGMQQSNRIIITAGFEGAIRIFENTGQPKKC